MKLRVGGRLREIPNILVLLLLDFLLATLLFYTTHRLYASTPYYPVFLGFSILATLLLPFGYLYREYLRTLERERYFPQFLKDIADVYRTGVSLVRAIYHASSQNYGALTPQVKKLAIRLSWGVPFEQAFQLFAEETKSSLIKGASLIILEAFNSGGDVASILDTVAEDIRRMKGIKEERKSRFAPFVGTMYVVFLVSVALAHILLNVLLPEMPVLPSFNLSFNPMGGSSGLGGSVHLPIYEMKILFLHLLLVQAVISGILAGLVGEGSWTAGLRHVLVMSFITLLLFQLFILPTDPVERIGRILIKIPTAFSITVNLGTLYVEKNILKDDVIRTAKSYGGIFGHATPPSFTFQEEPVCGGCGRDFVVTSDAIYIRKPLYLRFRVVSNGDGTVTVFVGG